MAELADATGLGPVGQNRAGSIPVIRSRLYDPDHKEQTVLHLHESRQVSPEVLR